MKKLFTTIAVGIFASMSSAEVFADVAANALPSLNNKINAEVTTNNSNMNIQITGGKNSVGTLNWNEFNVGKDATVNYEFSAHNQTAFNKVSANGGLSQIYGSITNSGCAGCGYDATGKVILINPNGVLFGDGANVNLNSFTVSTLDGIYDNNNDKLILNKTADQTNKGIVVQGGAKIYGDKNVAFASNNVSLYNGSKISTNTAANVGDTAYGKVKIVTADGVNFAYYNNGAIKGIEEIKNSSDKMLVSMNGDITSGHIDVRNHSENTDSAININGGTLKAVKAVKGNDGNIWLTALNKVVLDNAAKLDAGKNIKITAGEKVSIAKSDLKANENIDIVSKNHDVVVDKTTLKANAINGNAGKVVSIQNGTEADAKTIVFTGKDVWVSDSSLKADQITATATNDVLASNADLNNSDVVIEAGHDVDIDVKNVGDRKNDMVAKAGNNMKITTDGDLAVQSLISGNDMTINAKQIVAGDNKTTEVLRETGDSADRAYIEVGGTFTSNPNFEVTDSADLNAEKTHQNRHHIQYNNGEEKILLVNKRPFVAPPIDEPKPPVEDDKPPVQPDSKPPVVDPQPPVVEPEEDLSADDEQAKMLNKLPRQPEIFNNKTTINDGRTTVVDVFAAASQIEIVEDEEE